MLEESYISDKKISRSMTKLNRVSSDKKFRVKSLRMKTQQKLPFLQSPIKKSLQFPSLMKLNSTNDSPSKHHTTSLHTDLSTVLINNKLRVKSSMLEKDYEYELIHKLLIPKNIFQEIFRLKLEMENIKATNDKYVQFCKMLFMRLNEKVQISMQGFNLKGKALERFLEFFIQWKEKNIIGMDLSLCSQLAFEVKTKQQEEEQLININSNKLTTQQQQYLWPKNNILTRLILQDQRLCKLSVRNMHISPQQMVNLLTSCLKSKKIYSLEISNKSSQSINRLGTDYYYLEAFFAKNQYVNIMKMDNLNITDECVERIWLGMVKNGNNNPVRILSLSGNLMTEKSLPSLYNIFTKAGLTELNLSNNPLGRQFFISLKTLRSTTIKYFDLSSTGIDSQSLIHFLEQVTENKFLEILKLDNNDFSHHWFNKIKEVFENGLSLHSLSMVNCGIKNFDYLFQGITHSKYLRRLNLNYNLVDVQNEKVQKVVNCLKTNKTLQELRIRFSGYNQTMLCQLLQPLKSNQHIELIDISQNHMSDNGGKLILKMLTQSKSIKEIGIEKLQFTVKMTEQILKLIEFNRQVREKDDFVKLIDVNKLYRAKDNMSWDEIERLTVEAKRLEKVTVQAKTRNQKIQSKIQTKKEHFLQLRKQCKNQERKIDRDIKTQEIKINNLVKKIQTQIETVELKQQQMLEAIEIEKNLILTLQNKIAKENQKIKKRQHQLQEQLRDQKYLQKRKEKIQKEETKLRESGKNENQKTIKPKHSSQMFDNTKGLTSLSKRKGSGINKKG